MRNRHWIVLPLLIGALLSGDRQAAVQAGSSYRPPPVVIAIVEVGRGLNVMHSDFRLAPGQGPARVAGMPETSPLPLPAGKSFARSLSAARGTFGSLRGERLYSVTGTRIAGLYAPEDYSILEEREHGTGTASSAVGLTYGTAPNALLVFVPDTGRAAWDWVAEQEWIDVVSSSYFTVLNDGTCPEVNAIREITGRGDLVFTSAGNQEPGWTAGSPSGVPEAYQVGGVDSQGRTYLPPGDYDPADPVSFTHNSTRPYETGDEFNRTVADHSSLSGHVRDSGTSFAAPATAGRAATLIEHARTVLRTPARWDRRFLATLGPGGTAPERGPLSDGKLTSGELVDVLHHTARPAEVESPARYLVEGFGAHSDGTTELAKAVLSGTEEEPARSQEDDLHARVEAARAHFYPSQRCG